VFSKSSPEIKQKFIKQLIKKKEKKTDTALNLVAAF
jgi:hypothetical protein